MLLSRLLSNLRLLLQLGLLPPDLGQPALSSQLAPAVLDIVPTRESEPVAEVAVLVRRDVIELPLLLSIIVGCCCCCYSRALDAPRPQR